MSDKKNETSIVMRSKTAALWKGSVLLAIERGDFSKIKTLLGLDQKGAVVDLNPDCFAEVPRVLNVVLKKLKAASSKEESENMQGVLYHIACCYLVYDAMNNTKALTPDIIDRIGSLPWHPLDFAISYGFDKELGVKEMLSLFRYFGKLGMETEFQAKDEAIQEKYQQAENEGLALYHFHVSRTSKPFLATDLNSDKKFGGGQQTQQKESGDHKKLLTIDIPENNVELKQRIRVKKSDTTSQTPEALPEPLEEELLESVRALYVAARKGNLETVKQLVEQGAPFDFFERSSKTNWVFGEDILKNALSGAALCLDPEKRYNVIKFLIERGANPAVTITTGRIYEETMDPGDLLSRISNQPMEPWNISRIIDVNRVEENNPFDEKIIQLINAEIEQRQQDAKSFQYPDLIQRVALSLGSVTSAIDSLRSAQAELVEALPTLSEAAQKREAAVIERLLRDVKIRINKIESQEMEMSHVRQSSGSSQASSSVPSTGSSSSMAFFSESPKVNPSAYSAIDPTKAQSLAIQYDKKSRLEPPAPGSHTLFFSPQSTEVGDKKELLDKSVQDSDKEDQVLGKLSQKDVQNESNQITGMSVV